MRHLNLQAGSIMITLLVFVVVGLIVTTAAVALVINNTLSLSQQVAGTQTLVIAEAGAENAILRLLRDPSYTGETMSVDGGEVSTLVVGSSPIIVVAEARLRSTQRAVEVQLQRIDGVLTVISWKEVL